MYDSVVLLEPGPPGRLFRNTRGQLYQVVLFKLSISTVYRAEVVSAGGFLGDA